MLTEIKSRYRSFGDALVNQVTYNSDLPKSAIVHIRALNWNTNLWENIKLSFIDIIKFRFFESKKINSTVILEAYIENIDAIIVFDFFAAQLIQGKIAEDPNSDFVIHCKEIKYELIEVLSS